LTGWFDRVYTATRSSLIDMLRASDASDWPTYQRQVSAPREVPENVVGGRRKAKKLALRAGSLPYSNPVPQPEGEVVVPWVGPVMGPRASFSAELLHGYGKTAGDVTHEDYPKEVT
jgi:hypothetical protein